MRKCYYCRKPYFRCEKVAAWVTRNEGHRAGWAKQVISACLDCSAILSAFTHLSKRRALRRVA